MIYAPSTSISISETAEKIELDPFAHDDSDGSSNNDEAALLPAQLPRVPVKMEIGAGGGDWVVAQAAIDMQPMRPKPQQQQQQRPIKSASSRGGRKQNHKDEKSFDNHQQQKKLHDQGECQALWLALELRCDRVHDIFTKSFMASSNNLLKVSNDTVDIDQSSEERLDTVSISGGLKNLAILGGDASAILKQRIAPCSVDAIFINYPEPPERTGGEQDSQGSHLLTQDFFHAMHRVLTPQGRLTIVTDNLPYGQSLATSIAETARTVLAKRHSMKQHASDGPNEHDSLEGDHHPRGFVSCPLIEDASSLHPRTLEEQNIISRISSDENSIENKGIEMDKPQSGVIRLQSGREGLDNASARIPTIKSTTAISSSTGDSSSDDSSSDGDSSSDDDDSDDNESQERKKNASGSDCDSNSEVKISGDDSSDGDAMDLTNNKKPIVCGRNGGGNIIENDSKVITVTAGAIQLWRGQPNEDIGHHETSTASYFDKMWDRGKKKKRYYLYLKKM